MLSVVIPCYNEEKNISLLLDKVLSAFSGYDAEILLVNNGSIDNSQATLEREIANRACSFVKIVKVEKNQGYGHGILSGLQEAKGDTLAWTHADLQTDPKDVIKAHEKYKSYNDVNLVVKGKRLNRRIAEAFFTWGMKVIATLALKQKLDDINAQPKLFSREFYLKHLQNEAPIDFSLDLFLLYKATLHGSIKEVPVYFEKRLHGEAKGGGSLKTRIKLIKRTLDYIFKLRRKLLT